MTGPERIQSAAVIVRGRVFEGASHKVAVHLAFLTLEISPATIWAELEAEDQGFTTTRGRFVSRADAYEIAERRGQLCPHRSRWNAMPGLVPELHSEDLR
jgi:hypothetical protein